MEASQQGPTILTTPEKPVSYTRFNHATISSTPTRLIGADPKRIALVIVNHGRFALYVGFNEEVADRLGFYVEPDGGSLSLTFIEDKDMVKRNFYACAPDGEVTVWWCEEVEL